MTQVQSISFAANQNTNLNTIQNNPEPHSPNEEKKGTNKKTIVVASVAGAAAIAATTFAIISVQKNAKALQEVIQGLTKKCKNTLSVIENHFGSEQVTAKLAEIAKLPKKEQQQALNELSSNLYYAQKVHNHVIKNPGGHSLPKGMKVLPEDVKAAYEAKDAIKTGELLKAHVNKLSNTHKATNAGATISESIEKILGKDSKIEPHTYDLSKESPVIGVYRNCGGYKDGRVGKDGVYYLDGTIPDEGDICASIAHGLNGGRGGNGIKVSHGNMSELNSINKSELANPDRKVVRLEVDDINAQGNTPFIITVLSQGKEYTPLQKDLIKLAENPEKVDISVFEKITRFADSLEDIRANDVYKNLDYDVLLSAIQSMVK